MKILLLENNFGIYSAITKSLLAKGHKTDVFFSVKDALEAIDNGYACYILAGHSNMAYSMEILKKIRNFYPEVPIIMINLQEECDLQSLKDAYMYGCSDFIKKPFLIEELEVKIEKLCHVRNDFINIGPKCQFNFKTSMLNTGNNEKHFSRKESLLFSVLYSNKNSIVSFETIKAFVWGGQYVSLESIRSLIRRIRKKIPFSCIETIVDAGYVLRYTLPIAKQLSIQEIKDTRYIASA